MNKLPFICILFEIKIYQMKKLIICALALSAQYSLMAQVKKTTPTPAKGNSEISMQSNGMKNLLDSFSYAAGLNIANNMKDQGITDINTALMMNAIEDVMKDNNAGRKKTTVATFYMDETEVTNQHWLEYMYWMQRVYNKSYPHVYKKCLPDTLAWRKTLGYREKYVNYDKLEEQIKGSQTKPTQEEGLYANI
jgi:formylglycine-generating enzyme required for sulfatase activity